MTTTIYENPNYSLAQRCAYQTIFESELTTLPINFRKIERCFPNLKIRTFSWMAKTHNMSFKEVCKWARSEEGCCWYRESDNTYIILYNEKIGSPQRIRWTIAHELGHFILKHNQRSNKRVMSRGPLSDSEYEVFEKEANCFARNLLVPIPIFSKILTEVSTINLFDIGEICDISYEAAEYIINHLNDIQHKGLCIHSLYPQIAIPFEEYIENLICELKSYTP
ncbi:ImmA/IrrE family metallo-endopeptidase [Bacillus albus]|uniref:ImmA/IrrE family metallo-endopeptidase n=1 Tax=Bacillus albus TaxID=2026189 RepID=UPI0010200496|nr:ImmA/IrrE family metallo-endopeptidase [Bacillus albus]